MAVDPLPNFAGDRALARDLALRVGAVVPFGLGASIAAVAAEHGGYFPTSWGWTALALLALAAVGLATEVRLGRRELWFLGALGGLATWIGLSALWSPTVGAPVAELQRALVYVAGALAFLFVVSRATAPRFLAGLAAGIAGIAAYALAARLFPDRLGSPDVADVYRLAEPVGYWNGLGILVVLGIVLALGLAARGRPVARASAAASLPVLVAALYFTFSRGAWAALAVGIVAALALDPRRLQLAGTATAVAPAAIAAAWLGSRSTALTTRNAPVAAAAHDGHRLAVLIAALATANALVALGLVWLEPRVRIGRAARRSVAAALAAVLAAGIVAVLVREGGPGGLAHRAYRSFAAPPNSDAQLGNRLLSLSSDGRIDLWRVAWRDFERHPLLGSGAGTYERAWHRHRTSTFDVKDAHSLYLETLAELGPVGLGLLLLALGLPVVAACRVRTLPAAFGAYAAFLVHAAVDWDWELPAIVLAGVGCGVALLASARERPIALRGAARAGVSVALVAAAVFAAVGLEGNRAVAAGNAAIADNQWRQAAADARRAERWAPWSPRPWRILGDARFGQGDFAAAAAAYRRAIAKDPGDWYLWFDLGFAEEGAPARAAFERAAELDPLNGDVARALAAARR